MHVRQFQQTNDSARSSAPSAASSLASRPFAPQPQPEPVAEPKPTFEETMEKLERLQRAGHSLSKMKLDPSEVKPPHPIQMKLKIGTPGDKYEREADRVARQVVSRLHAPELKPKSPEGGLQRAELPETEERLTVKPEIGSLQRMNPPDEDELRMKPLIQPKLELGTTTAPTELERSIASERGRGKPLADTIRQPMERAFGSDFSGVRIHANGRADWLNRSIRAKAFTTGRDVFFRQGAYQPGSRGGQELLAHELTHVVQQSGALVRTKYADQNAPADDRQSSKQAPKVLYQSGSDDVLQAKLMTGKELEALTGVDRRNFLSRGFKALGGKIGIGSGGSSYDDILGKLESYEKLEETDTNYEKKAKRLAVLTDLETKIFAWYQSSNRERNEKNEVVATNKGDAKKIEILQELMYQVVIERDSVASMSESIESGIEQTKNITSDSPLPQEPNSSESIAQQSNQQQKTFWASIKDGFSQSWHYTFGNEFYPKKVVPLHMDFVSEYDIRRSVELIELAMQVEKDLLANEVDPLKATTLAYQYLPVQLRPRSPEPEEKVVLKVKLQIFKESLKHSKQGKEVSEQVKDITDKVGTGSSVYTGAVTGLETVSAITKDIAESNTDVSYLVGSIGEVVSAFAEIFTVLSKSSKENISETEQSQNEEQALMGALKVVQKLTMMGQRIENVSVDDNTPILGIFSNVLNIIYNLIKGAKLVIRYVQEGQLNQKVEAAQSGLLGALQSTAKRSRFLAISSGSEIIISALKIIGELVAAADAGITKAVGTVLKVAKKVVEAIESSYAAGLSQESQLESESGIEGSSKKVLESSTKWGVTAIILEAKDGNEIAIKKLELYGIRTQDIDTMEVEDIRKVVMEELERKENEKTLRQKIPIVGKSVKG